MEAVPLSYNEGKSVTAFLKTNIFSLFGTPQAILRDEGSHFCYRLFKHLLENYEVNHSVSTSYDPQTSGQVKYLIRD